ncbi:very short patch repair endonuclease [Pseudomonas sp. MWU13-2100]|uniref:very short patch repair endonuclease n=1 Tax=Pseudomonas sp. MWU13-2100 TaxID=2935075 RepID=UPI00298C4E9D|nr:very short patch repair endonuclease [Pseudomonas sp. MWU13-2100]
MSSGSSSRPMPSSELASAVMKRVRSKDTAPEMALRKLLFAAGLRYRIHYKPKTVSLGRSNIDIAFPGKKLAVFVDGCFWHGCPVHGTIPKANRDWWAEKLQSNRTRDDRVTALLTAARWDVLRFWTHQSPESMIAIVIDRLKNMQNQ